MPMSCAAPLSSEQARMALPILVFVVKRVRPTMTMMATTTVAIVTELMTSWPSKSTSEGRPTTDLKAFGSAPQMSSAAFCSR